MAFIETPRFPFDFNYASRIMPRWSTDVIEFGNGTESRNANWTLPLLRYDMAYKVKDNASAKVIYDFFMAMRGKFNGFRLKDLHDFTSAADGKSAPQAADVLIGVGDGVETQFQLVKLYTEGTLTTTRTINKLVADTEILEVNGAAQTDPTNYTVNDNTGLVTFAVAPPNTHQVTAAFEFDVPARFDTDDMPGLSYALYGAAAANDIVNFENIQLVEIRP